MVSEPFVMRDEALARQWVSVCSESCGFETEKAALILANLCGFGSWDIMTYAIGTLPPSALDENIADQERNKRLRQYVQVLFEDHGLSLPSAISIIDNLSPSSARPAAPFDYCDDDDDEDIVDPLMATVSAIEPPACPERTMQIIPLCRELDSDHWRNAFEYLGWVYDDLEYLTDRLSVSDASFVMSDDGAAVPAYLCATLPPPMFNGEIDAFSPFNVIQYMCLGNFMSQWKPLGAESFVILSRWPSMCE